MATQFLNCLSRVPLRPRPFDHHAEPAEPSAEHHHQHHHRPQAELQPAATGSHGDGSGGSHVGNPSVHPRFYRPAADFGRMAVRGLHCRIIAWTATTGSVVFRGDGTFALGGAGGEPYWAIPDARLLDFEP